MSHGSVWCVSESTWPVFSLFHTHTQLRDGTFRMSPKKRLMTWCCSFPTHPSDEQNLYKAVCGVNRAVMRRKWRHADREREISKRSTQSACHIIRELERETDACWRRGGVLPSWFIAGSLQPTLVNHVTPRLPDSRGQKRFGVPVTLTANPEAKLFVYTKVWFYNRNNF